MFLSVLSKDSREMALEGVIRPIVSPLFSFFGLMTRVGQVPDVVALPSALVAVGNNIPPPAASKLPAINFLLSMSNN
jgi:hypothetical protein